MESVSSAVLGVIHREVMSWEWIKEEGLTIAKNEQRSDDREWYNSELGFFKADFYEREDKQSMISEKPIEEEISQNGVK